MADKKVTALTDLGDNIASADLFHVVDDPTGTPINKKIAAEDVFNNIPSFLGLKQASQAITADGSSTTAVNVTTAITEINGDTLGAFLLVMITFLFVDIFDTAGTLYGMGRMAGKLYEDDNIESADEGGDVLVNYRLIDQQSMKKGDVFKIGTALLQYYEI